MYKIIFFLDLLKTVYDRRKYEYFFPRKVYRCACLGHVITSCLHDGIYALADILDEIKQTQCNETKKIFCVKCGRNDQHVVFTFADHMSILIIVAKRYDCTELPNTKNVTVNIFNGSKTYCCGCIRKYLREMYNYYHYLNFDLPFSIKKRKLK